VTLQRELSLAEFAQKRSQEAGENATRMLKIVNDSHQKQVAALQTKIHQLEGPGYADNVEPAEVAGKGIEWWAGRARYFEQKLREAEQKTLNR